MNWLDLTIESSLTDGIGADTLTNGVNMDQRRPDPDPINRPTNLVQRVDICGCFHPIISTIHENIHEPN